MKSRAFFTIFFIAAFFQLVALCQAADFCGPVTWSDTDYPAGSLPAALWNDPSRTASSGLSYNIRVEGWQCMGITIRSYAEAIAQTEWGKRRTSILNTYSSNYKTIVEDTGNYVAVGRRVAPFPDQPYDDLYLGGFNPETGSVIEVKTMVGLADGQACRYQTPDQLAGIYARHKQQFDIAKAIVDGKCGGNAPKITIEPSTYPEFQLNILKGNGFSVKIRKEDGIKDNHGNWKLNWSTLIFATNGVDNSMHLISTVMDQGIVSISEDDKEVRFNVKPDPTRFMRAHNVFNIQGNGEHNIGLQICDTDGRCGSSVYTIYFGPFIWAESVADLRCNDARSGTWKEDLALEGLVLGNIGGEVDTALYVALAKSEDDYWFHTSGVASEAEQWSVWYHGQVTPFIAHFPMPDGFFQTLAQRTTLDLRFSFIDASGAQPFPAGSYTFSAVVMDLDSLSGKSKGFSKDVTTCH